ncbi:hypothetical protein LDENG_00230810 [Lucifuga dentata]|nr:hypothetical protein LDENG_00230810 [Lucifuga dentata]
MGIQTVCTSKLWFYLPQWSFLFHDVRIFVFLSLYVASLFLSVFSVLHFHQCALPHLSITVFHSCIFFVLYHRSKSVFYHIANFVFQTFH